MSTNEHATLLIITCPVFERDAIFGQEAKEIAEIYGAEKCEIMDMTANNSPEEICERINRPGSCIRCLHFIGHGDLTVEDQNVCGFYDPETGSLNQSLTPKDYAKRIFAKASGSLDLVFLNACETISVGELLHREENAKCVIFWDTRAQTDAAKQFSGHFYRKLKQPAEKHQTWSLVQQCHAAFHEAKRELAERWNVELNPDADQFALKVKKKKNEHGQLVTTMRTNSDGSGVTITGSTVIKPNKLDSRNRKMSGRPRILPALPTSRIPLQRYHFMFRPVGEGVILAEGPNYLSNLDHWPGQDEFLAEVIASVRDAALEFVQSGKEEHDSDATSVKCKSFRFERVSWNTTAEMQQLRIHVVPQLEKFDSTGTAWLQFRRFPKVPVERAVFVADKGVVKIGCKEIQEKDWILHEFPFGHVPRIEFMAKVPKQNGKGGWVEMNPGPQKMFLPPEHICIVQTLFKPQVETQSFNYMHLASNVLREVGKSRLGGGASGAEEDEEEDDQAARASAGAGGAAGEGAEEAEGAGIGSFFSFSRCASGIGVSNFDSKDRRHGSSNGRSSSSGSSSGGGSSSSSGGGSISSSGSRERRQVENVTQRLLRDSDFPMWKAIREGKVTANHVLRAIKQLRGQSTEAVGVHDDNDGEDDDNRSGVLPAARGSRDTQNGVAYCSVIPVLCKDPPPFDAAEKLCSDGQAGTKAAVSLLAELVCCWLLHAQLTGTT
jgi:uncharacterized membrane protein YgcG